MSRSGEPSWRTLPDGNITSKPLGVRTRNAMSPLGEFHAHNSEEQYKGMVGQSIRRIPATVIS